MGKKDKCSVFGCQNQRNYPENEVTAPHVIGTLKYHKFPTKYDVKEKWIGALKRSKSDFEPISTSRVCSNHFENGDNIPTRLLKPGDILPRRAPKRRFTTDENKDSEKKCKQPVAKSVETQTAKIPGLRFEDITRESDVIFYTGFKSSSIFQMVYGWLLPVAQLMSYSGKETSPVKSGPDRKLSYQEEFLMVMMKLRLGLLSHDLAFRFGVSQSSVSTIFNTWIRMMSRELQFLIIWPTRCDVRRCLPRAFKKWFPNVRAIIDCTECTSETPSALDVQAYLWSEYKHSTTVKFLVSISPTGLISYVSRCYGGRASDQFIVKDSQFIYKLDAGDQILADRGFKIKEELMLVRASLAIPPSMKKGKQLTASETEKTSKIANTRIYVEKCIGRMKNYRITSQKIPAHLLRSMDDVIIVCAALCNLLDPICEI